MATSVRGLPPVAQEAREVGNIREQAVFEILAAVTSAAIKPESTDEFFADVFQNLTDEHLDFLTEIACEISDPELQARVADILWVRRRNYRMGQLAVTGYLQSAAALEDPEKWNYCYERIERALRLARKINHQADTVVNYIEIVLDRYNGEDPRWLSAKLMELLQEYRLGDATKYATLAEKAATLAESGHDWRRARNLWDIKAVWHRIERDNDKERAASMLAAETYVKEAEDALKRTPPSYLIASRFMQQAFTAFKNIRGTKEETSDAKAISEEVHKLLIQYQEESRKELISSAHEFKSSEMVEQAKAHVKGKSFLDAILALSLLGAPTNVSNLRQQVQDHARELTLSHFFPVVIVNQIGKVTARQSGSVLSSNPDEAEAATRFEMNRNAIFYQTFHAQGFIEPARYQINLEHSVRLNDLLSMVSNSPFVPPEREYLFAKGLYAGLTGDFFTSTHILIPQIENSIRYLLWQKGVITSGLDDSGIQNEHNLNSTLYRPEITSIFDENTLFDLKCLLVDHSGSNLRNRMAHGLISDGEFLSPLMSYLWWLTLRLCCLPILIHQQKVEQSDPWVKFAGMFKDDPLFDEFVEDMAAYRRELDAEVAALWDDCIQDDSTLGRRDAALLAVLTVGLRRSEVTYLDLSDFKPRSRSLEIREAKGRKERIVYLPEGGVQAVLDWLLIREKAPGPLFYPLNKAKKIIPRRMSEQGVLRALQRRGEKADVEAFTPHDFRRTFIGNLLDAGADIVTIAKLAGHASPSTTSKYDRRGEAAKKRAIDLLNVPYSRRDK